MIPQKIHYCWFGRNPLPAIAIKCINSWKKYLPDYEIFEWNEDNFDVNAIPYIKDAYTAKKYAFVSDYARFWVLYNYGGLYFDTDVEVINSFDDILSKGSFMGCESKYIEGANALSLDINPGLGLAMPKEHPILKELLDKYATLNFYNQDGSMNIKKTIVAYTTEVLCEHDLEATGDIQECAGILIYPKEYFCPTDYITLKTVITPNTRSIHHYSATWQTTKKRELAQKILGFKTVQLIDKIRRRLGV